MSTPTPQDPQPLKPPPASGTGGGALPCAHCQRPNPADRRFCAGCGKPLWEPCLICGTLGAAGEAFCGNCGVSLSAAVQVRRDEMERACKEAAELAARHEFEQALERLNVLVHLSDGRLAQA